jgi:single-strand DNA-binding protein
LDINLVVLGGRLAAPAEHRTFPSGAEYLRLLVTVRSNEPRRRVDVVPVTLWEPDPELVDTCAIAGTRLSVVGSLQRRFWAGEGGRRSRLELIACHVEPRTDGPTDAASPVEGGGASNG